MSSVGGKRHGAGRPKGSRNRINILVEEKLQEAGCDPIQAMIEIAAEARGAGDIKVAADLYKELAGYVHAKRKFVEHSGDITTTLIVESGVPDVED